MPCREFFWGLNQQLLQSCEQHGLAPRVLPKKSPQNLKQSNENSDGFKDNVLLETAKSLEIHDSDEA